MCEISPKWRIWGEIHSKQVRHHRRHFSFSKEFSSIIFPVPKMSVMEHPYLAGDYVKPKSNRQSPPSPAFDLNIEIIGM